LISGQRRKQRRAYFNASNHLRRKFLSSHLSEELRKKYGIRALPVREGDTALVLRGDYAGVEGKITEVYPSIGRVAIEGATREKVDGSRVNVPIRTSKIAITKLNLQDKARKLLLERRGLHVKEEVVEEETKKVEEAPIKPSEAEGAAPESSVQEAVEEEERPKPKVSRRRSNKAVESRAERGQG
jgi:large subunit ribosomal protein L24